MNSEKDDTMRKMGMLTGIHISVPSWNITRMPALDQIRNLDWIVFSRLEQKVFGYNHRNTRW
jgi:hypothetical protein